MIPSGLCRYDDSILNFLNLIPVPSSSGNQIFHTHCSCWYVLPFSFEVAPFTVLLENDWDIPHSHSSALFDAFLHPLLLESPAKAEGSILRNLSDMDLVSTQQTLMNERRKEFVSCTHIDRFGALEEFSASGRKVALLKIVSGKHDIPKIEGVQDTIRRMFGLY